MTDRIHDAAQAIEAAAQECHDLAAQVADAALSGIPEQARLREAMEAAFTKAEHRIRALADRIAPAPEDVAGRIWAWHRHDGTLNARLWEPMSDAPSFFPGEEYVPAHTITALSAQVAALTKRLSDADRDAGRGEGAAAMWQTRAEAAEARVAALTAERDAARAQVVGEREAALREPRLLRHVHVSPTTHQKTLAELLSTDDGMALYRAGDCFLIWVNEGDLIEILRPSSGPIARHVPAMIPSTPAHDVAQAARVPFIPRLVWSEFREGGCVGREKPVQYFITQIGNQSGKYMAHFDQSVHETLLEAKQHCDADYVLRAIG